jgi:DNA-binding NarL/FixJ family response regulator
MRIAIVDDNKLHRNKMKQVLKECRKKDDISDFENIRDYERSEGVYELLLLDIELKDEKGIRYIKNNPQKHRYVVYVSSYPEMMGEAFHSNVLGFIPKDKINALLVDKVNEVEQIDFWCSRVGNPILCLIGGLIGAYWVIGLSKNIKSYILCIQIIPYV